MPELEFRPGDKLKWVLETDRDEEPYTLKQSEAQGEILEMEDVNFHLNSAVLLPDNEDCHEASDDQQAEDRITGLAVIKILLKHAEDNPDKQILVAGHTDTTGEDDVNLSLSDLRAKSVVAVLQGQQDAWVKVCDHWSKVEDYQRIFKWTAAERGWDCDPGEVDDLRGDKTKAAVKGFQREYNQDFEASIDVDGVVGKQTWGAVLDVYLAALAKIMEITVDELKGKQKSLVFLGSGAIGCGEKYPIEEPRKNDYRSEKNRRVEVLFFAPDALPTAVGSAGDRGLSAQIYTSGFYKFEHIPCEPITPPTLLKAYLQLKFKDEQGEAQPFPQGFPLIAKYANDTVQHIKLDEDGKVEFGVRRTGESFTLSFTAEKQGFLVWKKDAEKPSPLAYEQDVWSLDKDAKYFGFPHEWELSSAEWTVEGADTYQESEHTFGQLDQTSTAIGSADSPVALTLSIRWQYLQFVFWDRAAKKQEVVPLEIELQGWADEADVDEDKPEARARWAGEKAQALPWILASEDEDAEPLIRFEIDEGSFVTAGDEAPKLERGLTLHEANPERLDYYDVPKVWKSKGWWARLSAGTPDDPPSDQGIFKDMAAVDTTDTNPLMFFLDDMVLTDETLTPLPWLADAKPENRLTLFCNTFAIDGGSPDDAKLNRLGIFDPDTTNKQEWFSKDPTDITDRNYIATYPRWTRLIACGGNMFDCFDQRTPDGADVVGARAAVRYVDAPPLKATGTEIGDDSPARIDKPFFSVQPFYQQHVDYSGTYARPQGLVTPQDIVREWQTPHGAPSGWGANTVGRFDMVLARCCGKDDDGNEVAVNLQYFRLFFNFSPTNDSDTTGWTATTLQATDHNAFVTDACKNLGRRWNGDTPTHGDPVLFEPVDAAKTLRIKSKWFAQGLAKARAHYAIGIWDPDPAGLARAWMSSRGVGALTLSDNPGPWASSATSPIATNVGTTVPAAFTMAHEAGHGGSIFDEYNEQWTSFSHNQKSFGQNLPGDPYSLDNNALMMKGTRFVRTRYFWHAAEWCWKAVGTDLQIRQKFLNKGGGDPDDYVYSLPHHPLAPVRNYTHWPYYSRVITLWPPRGRCHLSLYALAKDDMAYRFVSGFTSGDKPLDGLLMVVVKIRWSFKQPSMPIPFATITGWLNQAVLSVNANLNSKYYATGFTLGGRTFDRTLIHFSPRFLVETYGQDSPSVAYINGHSGFTVPASDPAKTAYLTGPMAGGANAAGSWLHALKEHEEYHPRDFFVKADKAIAAGDTAWHTNTGSMAGRSVLDWSLNDSLQTDFAKWFADMIGLNFSTTGFPGQADILAKLKQVVLEKVTPDGQVKAI